MVKVVDDTEEIEVVQSLEPDSTWIPRVAAASSLLVFMNACTIHEDY